MNQRDTGKALKSTSSFKACHGEMCVKAEFISLQTFLRFFL